MMNPFESGISKRHVNCMTLESLHLNAYLVSMGYPSISQLGPRSFDTDYRRYFGPYRLDGLQNLVGGEIIYSE